MLKKHLKNKKIILTILVFIILIGGFFIIKKIEKTKEEFVQTNQGYYKKETDLFDVSIGTEEDSSEVVFKVENSKLSYKLPLEPNWKKNKEGNILAQSGNETFKYSFIKEEEKIIGLKGSLILKEKPKHNVYTFPMNLENIIRSHKASSREFYNKKNEKIIYMKEPFMIDSNGNQSKDINLRITNTQIALVPSKKWLSDKNREYPVTVNMSFRVADSIIKSNSQK